MARNKQQEDFSWELERRSDNIFPVGGTYYSDYAHAKVSIYKGNLNQALEVIASVTEEPQKFDKTSVHIWQVREGIEPSWAFKLPANTQLRDLTPNDLHCNYEDIFED
jgi:hypothetical protein